MTRLVNLTPHDPLVLWAPGPDGDRAVATLPVAGAPARCRELSEPVGAVEVGGARVPVLDLGFGEVAGLPDPEEGTVYVVSRIVVEALPGRTDLVHPAELVRDAGGTVVGCRALARPAR